MASGAVEIQPSFRDHKTCNKMVTVMLMSVSILMLIRKQNILVTFFCMLVTIQSVANIIICQDEMLVTWLVTTFQNCRKLISSPTSVINAKTLKVRRSLPGITIPIKTENPKTKRFLDLFILTNWSEAIPTAAGSAVITAKIPPITGSGIHSRQAPIFGEIPKMRRTIDAVYIILSKFQFENSKSSKISKIPIALSLENDIFDRKFASENENHPSWTIFRYTQCSNITGIWRHATSGANQTSPKTAYTFHKYSSIYSVFWDRWRCYYSCCGYIISDWLHDWRQGPFFEFITS